MHSGRNHNERRKVKGGSVGVRNTYPVAGRREHGVVLDSLDLAQRARGAADAVRLAVRAAVVAAGGRDVRAIGEQHQALVLRVALGVVAAADAVGADVVAGGVVLHVGGGGGG